MKDGGHQSRLKEIGKQAAEIDIEGRGPSLMKETVIIAIDVGMTVITTKRAAVEGTTIITAETGIETTVAAAGETVTGTIARETTATDLK